jgi:hypothetical protein
MKVVSVDPVILATVDAPPLVVISVASAVVASDETCASR